MKKVNVLITGANFSNKGAQSMLFITVNEIRKRFNDAEIFFLSSEQLDLNNYRFDRIDLPKGAWRIACGGFDGIMQSIFRLCKDEIKYFTKKGKSPKTVFKEISKLEDMDFVIDISGYAIGAEWGYDHNKDYVDRIRFAKKKEIPFYIFPQSIGSFEFDKTYGHKRGQALLKEYKTYLKYPNTIFVREKEGIKRLNGIGIRDNVVLSTDLVLQNTGINLSNIFKNVTPINVPSVHPGAVGIIPNIQCFRHGNKNEIIALYTAILNKLLEMNKEVYIFRHSSDDLSICREIYSLVNSKHVFYLENDFSCLEYDSFIKQFDFIICSRYHGNVHAYRNLIPSVLLGWAIKYKELAELVGQGEYSFDITNVNNDDIANYINAIEKMCYCYDKESKVINTYLEQIRKNNCFDQSLGVYK